MVVGVAEGLALVEKGAAYRTERADSGDRTRPVDTVLFEGAAAELLADSLAARDRLSEAAAVLLDADACGGAEHCVKMSVDYARVREQYSQPIAAFKELHNQLHAMALAHEPDRGHHWDATQPC